jgi:hypothetical protein
MKRETGLSSLCFFKRSLCRYAAEEMLIALGLADEDGSAMKFLRAGYKTSTWWEEDNDLESSDLWRT